MNFGMFIQLSNLVEGLVHISEITGDYYIFDEKTKILKGQRKGKTYKIGQKVKVIVTKASKYNSTVDFNLVEEEETHGNNKYDFSGFVCRNYVHRNTWFASVFCFEFQKKANL